MQEEKQKSPEPEVIQIEDEKPEKSEGELSSDDDEEEEQQEEEEDDTPGKLSMFTRRGLLSQQPVVTLERNLSLDVCS